MKRNPSQLNLLTSNKTIKIFFDGSADNANTYTHAGVGVAVAIEDNTQAVLAEEYFYLPNATNNVAEYLGLVAAITLSKRLGIKNPAFYSDSQLVVGQVAGLNGKKYKVNHPDMKTWNSHVKKLISMYLNPALWTLEWIPREKNQEAGTRAYAALQEYCK